MPEDRVGQRLGELAGLLVAGCERPEFLDRVCAASVDLLSVPGAAIMVPSPGATLHVAAASRPAVWAVENLQTILEEGPGIDAYRTGREVVEDDLATAGRSRWPRYAPVGGRAARLTAVRSLPMRVREHRVGVLDLFPAADAPLDPAAITTARSLADLATIGLLQTGRAFDTGLLGARLQDALRARVVIEQAAGVLAERQGVSPVEASDLLRRTAQRAGRRLADVARDLVDDTVGSDTGGGTGPRRPA